MKEKKKKKARLSTNYNAANPRVKEHKKGIIQKTIFVIRINLKY